MKPNTWQFRLIAIMAVFAGVASAQVSITNPSPLPQAYIGVPYYVQLNATGGTAPYTWSVAYWYLGHFFFTLPPGLGLNTQTGVISGTPTGMHEDDTVYIKVTDSKGAWAEVYFQLPVSYPALTITTSSPLPAGSTCASYSQPLSAAGGTQPYTWSITAGALPSGLVLNSTTGVISGMCTATGTFAFTVQVRDSAYPTPATNTKAFTITETGPDVGITTGATLPNGRMNTYYSVTLAASGGVAPLTWSLTAGTLPPGLALSSSGVLGGTPTQAGTYLFTVQVRSSSGCTASRQFSLTIDAALTIAPSSLPNANTCAAYSQTLSAAGGTAPYTWSIIAGSLPPGLALNNTTGVIGGMCTATGTFSFTVQVRDSAYPTPATNTKAFTITVTGSDVAITTGVVLPNGSTNTPYSTTLAASGGVAPLTWSVVAGSTLPPGLALSSSGVLSGTPTQAGTYRFTIQVRSSSGCTTSQQFSLTIDAGLITALPDASTCASYSHTLSVEGGTPPYTWSIIAGSLPPGLALNSTTGVISGMCTAAGTFAFTVQVRDSAYPTPGTATSAFTIKVTGPDVAITTGVALPNGSTGTSYSTTLAASGGVAPLTWSVAAGSTLPPGLALSSSGVLSGTPTQAGTYSFTVQVLSSSGCSVSKQFSLTIGAGLTITPPSLPDASTCASYSQTLSATGGTAPYTWSISSGSLPAGLALSAGGVISGTCTATGTSTFTVQVRDSSPSAPLTNTKQYTITVTGSDVTISTDTTLPNGSTNTPYSTTLAASGGVAPLSWSVAAGSTLPPWLTLSSSGVLSGTPTETGTYSFTIQVRSSSGCSASKQFSLTIGAVLTIATPSLPSATAGTVYSQTLAATGGTAPYNWTAASLPSWLSLSSTGVLSGTPTQAGSSTFTITVTDSAKPAATASKQFTLTVVVPKAPPISVTGLTDTLSPAQQPTLDVQLGSAYALAVTGTITLTFTPDAVAPSNDPSIQFSTGGRTLNFTIPAGQTRAFPASPPAIQTGTVAGRIDLTVRFSAGGQDITPTPAPSRSVTIARAAPKINSVQVVKTSGGFNVLVTGYSTPRQVTQAVFVFTATSGANLQTTQLTVSSDSAFTTWYSGASSTPFGSSFLYTQPFTVTGNVSAIASVSVTLSNAVGSSSAVSANVPN